MAVLAPTPDTGAGSQAGSGSSFQLGNKNANAIAKLAYQVGFRGQRLVDMVAIALAESGGNPNALNDNPKTGDYSVGYWQINYFGGLGAPRTQRYGSPDQLRGTDPLGIQALNNARAAYDLSGGGKTLSPWQADFNNGSYYRNLPDAQAAVANILGGPVSAGAQGSPTSFGGAGTSTPQTAVPEDHCLLSWPSVGPVGGGCLLSTNSARALGGGLLMAAGVIVAGVGVILLVNKSVPLPGGMSIPNPMANRPDSDDRRAMALQEQQQKELDTDREFRKANASKAKLKRVPASAETGDAF